MGQFEKLLIKILSGSKDKDVDFEYKLGGDLDTSHI